MVRGVWILAQASNISQGLNQNLVSLATAAIPKILLTLLVLVLTKLSLDLVGRLTRRALSYQEPTLRRFLVQIAQTLTLIAGIIIALDTLGIQTTTLVAIVGAAGLAIGLALQGTLSQFAAGVMLLTVRHFKVGDFIEAGGAAGVVESIGLLSTVLLTPDNIKTVVPNNTLFTGVLKNQTALEIRRVDFQVEIGDRPLQESIKQLLNMVRDHPLVLDHPEPTCNVLTVSEKNTTLYLRPWCQTSNYGVVQSAIQQRIREFFSDSQAPE